VTASFPADWLAARIQADHEARNRSSPAVIPALIKHLTAAGASARGVEVIDVGAGTGANARWLEPRLPFPQRWVYVEPDRRLLSEAHRPEGTEVHPAGVEALPGLLDRPSSRCRLLTCSALLDILTTVAVRSLCRAGASHQVPMLLALTVTGAWQLDPSHRIDEQLRRAFNDFQRRSGHAGPDAPRIAADTMRASGLEVHRADSPWLLTPETNAAFVDRFLTDRVSAVVEEAPKLAKAADRWLALRREQLDGRALRVEVGHLDILGLPDGREIEDGAEVLA
jgi:hypothetical protein